MIDINFAERRDLIFDLPFEEISVQKRPNCERTIFEIIYKCRCPAVRAHQEVQNIMTVNRDLYRK